MKEIDLPKTEILAQLGEEAAELAQAALKLRRALDGTNPTPVSEAEAWKALIEEFSDVALCCKLLKYSLQGTTQSRYLTGGVPPVRFSM